jgi:hypothetical protein
VALLRGINVGGKNLLPSVAQLSTEGDGPSEVKIDWCTRQIEHRGSDS